MLRIWKMVGAASLMAMLAVLTVLGTAMAQTPTLNDSPEQAAYIDGKTHTAPVGKSLWYKFDYRTQLRPSERTPIFLTLVNGNNSGVEYMVYTADQAIDVLPDRLEDWRSQTPTGRGTAQRFACNSHIPKANGDCVSNDLTWVGTFAESGPVFVRVRNATETPQNFTLMVQGADVSVANPMNMPNQNMQNTQNNPNTQNNTQMQNTSGGQ